MDIELTKYAQSTVLVRAGDVSLLIDPGSYAAESGLDARSISALTHIVVTHRHADHFHPPLVHELRSHHDPRWLVNTDVAPLMAELAIGCGHGIAGDRWDLADGFAVRFVRSEHLARGEAVPDVGLVLEIAGKTIYHASDTHLMEPDRIDAEPPIGCDVALLPISNRGLVMSIDDALYLVGRLAPKRVVPIHFDSPKDSLRVRPEDFVDRARQMGTAVPDVAAAEIVVLRHGESLRLE